MRGVRIGFEIVFTEDETGKEHVIPVVYDDRIPSKVEMVKDAVFAIIKYFRTDAGHALMDYCESYEKGA